MIPLPDLPPPAPSADPSTVGPTAPGPTVPETAAAPAPSPPAARAVSERRRWPSPATLALGAVMVGIALYGTAGFLRETGLYDVARGGGRSRPPRPTGPRCPAHPRRVSPSPRREANPPALCATSGRALPGWSVTAISGDRAWLRPPEGGQVTVVVGERLNGVGMVRAVDGLRGVVTLSDGRVVR